MYLEELEKKLKKSIIIEYLIGILIILVFIFLLPLLFNKLTEGNTGIDGIGGAMIIGIGIVFLRAIISIAFFIVIPIRLLIVNKNTIKNNPSKKKKFIYRFLLIIPIVFGLSIVFENFISDILYDLKFQTSFYSYKVSKENYKTYNDFMKELKSRGLEYNYNTYLLKLRLNADYDCINYVHDDEDNLIRRECYEESTLLGQKSSGFSDLIEYEDWLTDNSKKYPWYVYNSILVKPSENEDFRYAALGRYSVNSDDYGKYRAEFEDLYIECKILYIDGHIYVLIGPEQSFIIDENVKTNHDSLFDYNKPYNVLLSETKDITTFEGEKYSKKGSIRIDPDGFGLNINERVPDYETKTPIRVVDRIDIDTINEVAKEIQDKYLKKAIEYHHNRKTE